MHMRKVRKGKTFLVKKINQSIQHSTVNNAKVKQTNTVVHHVNYSVSQKIPPKEAEVFLHFMTNG